MRSTDSSTLWAPTGTPQSGQCITPSRAANTRKKSYISVSVPTVERGVLPVERCSIATAGAKPSIFSKIGFGT